MVVAATAADGAWTFLFRHPLQINKGCTSLLESQIYITCTKQLHNAATRKISANPHQHPFNTKNNLNKRKPEVLNPATPAITVPFQQISTPRNIVQVHTHMHAHRCVGAYATASHQVKKKKKRVDDYNTP